MFTSSLFPSMIIVVYRLLCPKFSNILSFIAMEIFILFSDNQFGFKKKSSCMHAVYTLRYVVDYYVNHSTEVNICAQDISKDFESPWPLYEIDGKAHNFEFTLHRPT